MAETIIEKLKRKKILLYITQLIIVFILSNVVTYLSREIWIQYNGVFNAFMELTCIFLVFASFFIMWCRYHGKIIRNQIIALIFLMIFIFHFLYTFYFAAAGFYLKDCNNLAARFWVNSRTVEIMLLAFIIIDLKQIKIKKSTGVLIALIYLIGISYLILFNKNIFQIIYISCEMVNIKILLENFIAFILIFTVWNLRAKLSTKGVFRHKYVYLTILLFILLEIFFGFYNLATAFITTYIFIFKILYYICLFKGILEIEINQPYIKLEKVNKQLKDMLNAIPLAIHTYDDDLNLIFANAKFEEVLECEASRITGLSMKKVLEIIEKVDKEDEIMLPESLINQGKSMKNLVRTYKTPEGNKVKLLVNIHKVENGIMFISNEAAREQSIENLNLQTQTILNSMLNPSMILDNQGVITACNKSLEELLDLEKENIIGISLTEINEKVKFNNKEVVRKFYEGILNDECYEASIVSCKGNEKYILGHVSSIYNVENEKIGIISVMQDVTEMRENQEKLINQEKLALLGQMGASIVHDTRNFLTTINGSCQLIELYSNDMKIKEYVRKIKLDTDEVNRIISDFLTLAKPSNIVFEEISVYDLFLSIKRLLETSSLIKGIDIEFDFNHDDRYMMCDQVRLRQVILNICKNAIESMESIEKPFLSIKTGIYEITNEIYVQIKDNGVGMPEEIISKLGTAFFTTKKNGTGLGLNACFQIVSEHQGRIDVKSELGIGTTFSIILPCIDDEEYSEELDERNKD